MIFFIFFNNGKPKILFQETPFFIAARIRVKAMCLYGYRPQDIVKFFLLFERFFQVSKTSNR
jgi:hypothetical protein